MTHANSMTECKIKHRLMRPQSQSITWTVCIRRIGGLNVLQFKRRRLSKYTPAEWRHLIYNTIGVVSHESSAEREMKDGGRVRKAWAPWLRVLWKSLAGELPSKEQAGCAERNKTSSSKRERVRTGIGGGESTGKMSTCEHHLLLWSVCELGLSAHCDGVCWQR